MNIPSPFHEHNITTSVPGEEKRKLEQTIVELNSLLCYRVFAYRFPVVGVISSLPILGENQIIKLMSFSLAIYQ